MSYQTFGGGSVRKSVRTGPPRVLADDVTSTDDVARRYDVVRALDTTTTPDDVIRQVDDVTTASIDRTAPHPRTFLKP